MPTFREDIHANEVPFHSLLKMGPVSHYSLPLRQSETGVSPEMNWCLH